MTDAEWIALAAALIAAAAGIWSVVVTIQGNRQLTGIRYQVANDHTTNLRDEMDEWRAEERRTLRSLRADVAADIGGLRQDVGGLRGELRKERQARMERDDEILSEIRRSS